MFRFFRPYTVFLYIYVCIYIYKLAHFAKDIRGRRLYRCAATAAAAAVHSIIVVAHFPSKEKKKKKEQHYAIYVYTLRHAMICQRPEAKNTGDPLRSRGPLYVQRRTDG